MRDSWIKELGVGPGDHIIAILTDEDDLELLSPYIADGLRNDGLCSVIALPDMHDALRGELREAKIDVRKEEGAKHFVFHDSRSLVTKTATSRWTCSSTGWRSSSRRQRRPAPPTLETWGRCPG